MNFAEFITNLYEYKNSKVTKKVDFVIMAFETSGLQFYYSNDVAKKISNVGDSRRPISEEIRSRYKNNLKLPNLTNFFKEKGRIFLLHSICN